MGFMRFMRLIWDLWIYEIYETYLGAQDFFSDLPIELSNVAFLLNDHQCLQQISFQVDPLRKSKGISAPS